jgi:hypothetical protein
MLIIVLMHYYFCAYRKHLLITVLQLYLTLGRYIFVFFTPISLRLITKRQPPQKEPRPTIL